MDSIVDQVICRSQATQRNTFCDLTKCKSQTFILNLHLATIAGKLSLSSLSLALSTLPKHFPFVSHFYNQLESKAQDLSYFKYSLNVRKLHWLSGISVSLNPS
jgi:hypothetical protein